MAKRKVSAKALKARADRYAGKACRNRGKCEAAGWEKIHPNKCGGRLSWAHIISRGALWIKHDPDNCMCLCVSCHQYFTMYPDEWTRFIEDAAPGRWAELHHKISSHIASRQKIDYEKWIHFYKEQGVTL